MSFFERSFVRYCVFFICVVLLSFVSRPVDAQVIIHRVNTGGPQVTGSPNWAEDTSGNPSPFVNTGNLFSTSTAIDMTDPSIPAGTPMALFQTERWDPSGAPEMQWGFPVTPGSHEVRLYFSDIFTGTHGVGLRVFDVTIEGTLLLDDYDIFADVGAFAGVVKSFVVSSDDTLDIDFGHVTENPAIKAIEVLSISSSGFLSPSPSSIDFGLVQINTNSSPTNITLSNLGGPTDPTIAITNITTTGEFSHTLTTQSIAPQASINFDVTFSPSVIGPVNGSIVITHDGTNSPTTLLLSGEGFDPTGQISFNKTTLGNTSSSNPTSLQFGPDNRLYVAQQNGLIKIYTVVRNGVNDYAATATETINLIQSIQNHNDDGSVNNSVTTRQVTGLLVVGTSANPVVYVSSSDPRIGAGGGGQDLNLDTNSGIISRLTWNGSQWDKLDLVRGLPRSEENHSSNGMQLDAATNILYLVQGGHCNQGAPSNNFALLPEYALSGAVLSIDLTTIGETTYDVPTLDDEDRAGINDLNDPFGGNDGKNQGVLVPSGPVQVFSPGWRNAFDFLITQAGRMYTIDNGPNGGWGDVPVSCTNAINEPGNTHPDNLHFITGAGYYGGHPNPTRGNNANTFNPTNPQSPVSSSNPVECNYLIPGVADGALATWGSSTNGLAEYTASDFGGQMQNNLIAASFNNTVQRIVLNATGDVALTVETLFSSVGATPLDITTQGDADVFNGTIWVCNYSSGAITIYEPVGGVICSGADDILLDEDGDGYSNADEIDNGTNPCSAADFPADWDMDFVSNLNDPDDDNDGQLDNVDRFAIDPDNGTTTALPINLSWNNNAPDPGGLLNLGWTGLMTNETSDYESLFDPLQMTAGGAAGVTTVDAIPEGDAFQTNNDQEYAFQLGFTVVPANGIVTVHSRILGPFAGLTPQDFQSMGIFFGNGDQDNYAKIVIEANGGLGGVRFAKEEVGTYTDLGLRAVVLPGPDHIDLYLAFNQTTSTVEASFEATTGGNTGLRTVIGSSTTFPSGWLAAPAAGMISTSRGVAPTFPATWDFFDVTPEDVPPSMAEAFVSITAGGGINASTFSSNSFLITNNSNAGEKITRVRFDLSTAIFPDMVFDPNGIAGDLTAKCFTPNSGASSTGLMPPADSCFAPFQGPHDDGFDIIEINFSDFDVTETFTFSVDVDPTTIRGTSAPGPNNSGSVSGLELVGAIVEIEFDNGDILTANPYRVPASNGGSQATLADPQFLPQQPVLHIHGVGVTPLLVDQPNRLARVFGPAGTDVGLLVVEGGLFTTGLPGGGFDVDPFEDNSAILVTEETGTVGAGGFVDIPFTLTDTDIDGGLNHIVAVLKDGAGQAGPVSSAYVLEYDATATGIPLVPTETTLGQNHPNPFNPTTTIDFSIARAAHTTLRVFDVAGRLVATLVDKPLAIDHHRVTWDGRNSGGSPVATGIYFYRLQAGDFVQTRRMVLLK